ncbi:MAG: GNAT family N-acetyltransferase [Novosphingobium sp.]
MEQTIIRLGPEQRDAAVATLAAAFQDDPAIAYMMPDPAIRPRRLTRLYRWMFAEHLRNGIVLGTPGCEVVTLWRPPGAVHLHEPIWHPGAIRFVPIFGRHIPRAIRLDDAIRAHLPADESWHYLRIAGVRPDAQGKGLGGRAIRAGLAEAARLGVPAVLETATPSNVGLYQRLGYDVASEWYVPKGGPKFWTMTNLAPAQ